MATFETVYQPGELVAAAYRNGTETGRAVLHTAGPDIRLTVTRDRVEIRADDTDLAFLDITIADRDGIPHVLQDRTLTVSIKRPQIMGEEHGSKR